MHRFVVILLLSLMVLSSNLAQAKANGDRLAICLLGLYTPAEDDLGYVVKAVNAAVINRLSQFPVSVYSGESAPARYFDNPDEILKSDKVQLLHIRRETGFDGLIFGSLEEHESSLILNLHLVDFSSGRIYFSGQFEGVFGSSLLEDVEKKITGYAEALISYYNCTLAITSEPEGAEIWLKAEKVGSTPMSKLDVKDGVSQIQVKKEGYVPFETQVDLQAGQKGLIHAQLYRYSLTATSKPSGASVYVNDQLVGITPIMDMALDQPNFSIRFDKDGFMPYNESISLSPGEQAYVHAELYDLLVDYFHNKDSPWQLDCHSFSYIPTFEIQNLEELELDAFYANNFRYYAKFGRFSAGLGMGVSFLDVSQHFDTFQGSGEGYESFRMELVKGMAIGQFNIIDKIDWLELYLSGFAGFSSATSLESSAPADLSEIRSTSPLAGGEVGVNFYLNRMFKLSAVAGGYYAGEVEYAAKEASYWGEAIYRREKVRLNPFYVGLALTISLWPALM